MTMLSWFRQDTRPPPPTPLPPPALGLDPCFRNLLGIIFLLGIEQSIKAEITERNLDSGL